MKIRWLIASTAATLLLAGQATAQDPAAGAAPAPAAPAAAPAAPAAGAPAAPAAAPADGAAPAAPAAAGAPVDRAAGEALAKKSGCFACHNVEQKRVGPSWKDVAAKYANDPGAKDNLVKWIHTGGTGRWKDPKTGKEMGVMPPYSPRVSDADINTLADFILSLK